MKWLLVVLLMMPAVAHATQVQEVTSGDVTAWLVEDHALPLLAVKIAFRDSGVAYDPKGKGGRAAMAAAMMMEGAGKLDASAFSKALEDHAIGLDFGVDSDMFSGKLTTTSEFAREAFALMGSALQEPRFDKAAIERVRQQMLSAIAAQEKEPNYVLSRRWAAVMFGDHAYANPELGTAKEVAGLSAEDLKRYVRGYLARDRLVISVVGDITPAALKVFLDGAFGALPAKAAADVMVGDVVLPNKAQQVVVESDIPQTVVVFGATGLMRNDAAFYDAYVMNYLLGGGSLSSRLFMEVREKRGLTYGISTGLAPMQHVGLWTGGFSTRNEKMGEALTVLRDTLSRFAHEGPTDEELASAKRFITGSFVLGLDSNHEIANYLMTMQLFHLGRDYLDKRNALMGAVTKDGVKAIAAKIIDPAHLQVVMVGKPVLDVKP